MREFRLLKLLPLPRKAVHSLMCEVQQRNDAEINRRLDAMAQGVACLLRDKKLEAPKITDMWRDGLKRALKENRSRQPTGSGEEYWQSVVWTVEEYLRANIK